MKQTRRYIGLLLLALSCPVLAQPTNKPTTVKGTLDIKYNSRITPGLPDVYALDLNVNNSAIFRGHITNSPPVVDTTITGATEVKRPAILNYQLACIVVNPRNPEQTLNVGRLYGTVPVSIDGVYNFSGGTLKVSINAMGRAQAFESKYMGLASGKPLMKRQASYFDRARASVNKEVQRVQKKVGGRTMTLVVTNYDKMEFKSHKMGAGPVQYYPDTTANGGMLYDGDRYAWYFQDVSLVYASDGAQRVDRLSGNIRWVEQPKKGSLRDGEYQFDVRVNEPPPDANAAFAAAANEEAFFEVDTSLAAWVGTMKYRDTFVGDKVAQSQVTIDLTGSRLSNVQTMNLTKLILLDAIVPLNAE